MKVPLHIVNSRRDRLATWLQQQTYVPLQEVCKRFAISEATARRDLAALVAQNKILRTYGGALSEYNQRFASFMERKERNGAAKRAIAKKARRLILPGTTCFLDAGTTIHALAEELQRSPIAGLVIVTNSMPVAELLANTPELTVQILGGHFLYRQSVLAGEGARKALSFYNIGQAFLSAEAMNSQGIWNSQDEIVALQRRVMSRSAQNIFCLDGSKLGPKAPSFLTGWNQVDLLVSDLKANVLRSLKLPSSKIWK
ncbi:MAG: DeoR/GlpR family DNA-binding transcription regulator [Verrucomicrobiota bacterium]|nr:DeoR/GlpR family DNA-binding transcription regulator [Verrucomicrobiota bacterium]